MSNDKIPHADTYIELPLDTARLDGKTGTGLEGVYMVDNRKSNGSTNEGTNELHTVCNKGDTVQWRVRKIDPTYQKDFKITGFQVMSPGQPVWEDTPKQVDEEGKIYQTVVTETGCMTYQIEISLNEYSLSWDPFLEVR